MALPIVHKKTQDPEAEAMAAQSEMARSAADFQTVGVMQQTPIPTVEYAKSRSKPRDDLRGLLHESAAYSFIPRDKADALDSLEEAMRIARFCETHGFDILKTDMLYDYYDTLYLYRSFDGSETKWTHRGVLELRRTSGGEGGVNK